MSPLLGEGTTDTDAPVRRPAGPRVYDFKPPRTAWHRGQLLQDTIRRVSSPSNTPVQSGVTLVEGQRDL